VHSAARPLALLAHGAGGCRLLDGGDFNDQLPINPCGRATNVMIDCESPGARSEGGPGLAPHMKATTSQRISERVRLCDSVRSLHFPAREKSP